MLSSDNDNIAETYEDASHPDRANRLAKRPGFQDVVNPWPGWNTHGAFATWTNWSNQNNALSPRGALDLNYAYDDGSVQRLAGVLRLDDRVNQIPTHNQAPANYPQFIGIQVPRQ